MIVSRSWSVGLCLVLAGAAVGCSRPSAPGRDPGASVSAGNGSTTWSRAPNQRPGVDQATVDLCSWNNELVFAVWSDSLTSTGGSSSTATGQAYFGAFPTPDSQIEYRGETADGRTGKVEFHTKDRATGAAAPLGRFDLADGALFLVAVRGKQPRVLQLKRDIRTTDSAGFQKLSETDAEIAKFFARAGAPP